MPTKKKQNPKIGMILEQREWMYRNELTKWLDEHPHATAQEIDDIHRRLAEKWQV